MTDLAHEQIRDFAPEYLHGDLDPAVRAAFESHLRACAECAAELRVVRMVSETASFAPMIDAVRVSSAILPYGGVPAAPAFRRSRGWRLALASAAAALVAVTLVSRGNQTAPQKHGAANQVASVPAIASAVIPTIDSAPIPVGARAASAANHSGELQVAVRLDGLSDGSVTQLARELDSFDGLPSADPESFGVSDPSVGNEGGV